MLKGLNPGKMDVKLTIEQPSKARNSINESEVSWSFYSVLWAKRLWTESSEKFEGKQEVGSDNVIFNARYNSGLNTTMRLKQDTESTYFYITDVMSTIEEGISVIVASRRDNA
jgi:head-tail adaptor